MGGEFEEEFYVAEESGDGGVMSELGVCLDVASTIMSIHRMAALVLLSTRGVLWKELGACFCIAWRCGKSGFGPVRWTVGRVRV